jgi:hypothetical protein
VGGRGGGVRGGIGTRMRASGRGAVARRVLGGVVGWVGGGVHTKAIRRVTSESSTGVGSWRVGG